MLFIFSGLLYFYSIKSKYFKLFLRIKDGFLENLVFKTFKLLLTDTKLVSCRYLNLLHDSTFFFQKKNSRLQSWLFLHPLLDIFFTARFSWKWRTYTWLYMEFLLKRAAKLKLMMMSLVHDDGLQVARLGCTPFKNPLTMLKVVSWNMFR